MLISPSKKVYVGQTRNLKRRFKKHKSTNGTCRILYRAIQKYGWDNFLKVIIEVFDDDVSDKYMDQREIYWIRKHEAFGPKGYNCTEGGGGVRGHKHSDETRAKLRKAGMGRHMSVETRAKLRTINVGKKMSAKSCEKMSKAAKCRSRESRLHSAETRAKISLAAKRKWSSAEYRDKQRKKCKPVSSKPVSAQCLGSDHKRTFDSINMAANTLAKETGLKFDSSTISKCCRKRPNYNSHHGWNFEFKIT